MIRKTWKVVFLLCLIGYFYSLICSIKFHSSSLRAAIVILTRGEPKRLLNVLHSIEYFHPPSMHKYPVIIFYDSNEIDMQQFNIEYIKSCVKLNLIFEKIVLFELMRHPTETIDRIRREKSAMHHRPLGYRLMCLFWSYTVFHHPLIKTNYDYIMRLDDDSLFLESLDDDLFEYIDENNLDYIYRALSWDISMAGPDNLLPKYLHTYHHQCQSFCFPFYSYDSVYNNFFLTRLQFWYQTKIEDFLNQLLVNDTIIIHSLGDGNIHAVILALASDTQHSQRMNFAYAHNIHLYGKGRKTFDLQHNYHNWFSILANNNANACREFLIIEPNQKQLKFLSLRND